MSERYIFLVTWITHNSRVSERMITHHVKRGKGIWMDVNSEYIVTEAIAEVVKNDDLKIMAYNICGDPVYIILVCEMENLAGIVQKLKPISSRTHNIATGVTVPITREHAPLLGKTRGLTQNSLWAQKYDFKVLEDEDALANAIEYVQFNREKHQLPPNEKLKPLIQNMTSSYEDIFGEY